MWLQLLIIVATCMFRVNAKLCQDVSVRNEVSSFEKHLRGCSVIAGNLEIALIEDESMDDYASVSFPELTEIRGFFLIYRVYGLTTLSHLFPNLTIIRGLTLFKGYSMVLFDLSHLEEIGLPSLKYIMRGSIRIEFCPRLCYINTVNWTLIGSPDHKLDYLNVNEGDCGLCPEKCNGSCWGKFHCQNTTYDNCHPECVGCTDPNSLDKCIECRSYRDKGTCVSDCPKETVRHPMMVSCMSDDDCYNNPLQGTWWTFQDECVKWCPPQYTKVQQYNRIDCEFCGDDCRKSCYGIEIDSKTSSDNLHGCTHIIGSLSIRAESKMRVDELYRNLAMIEEIDGYLKIHRSAPLTSLDFLQKLRIIHGNLLHRDRHVLIAFENQNLRKLWRHNQTVEVRKGTIYFHYNSKLCLSEIENFAKEANLTYTEFDVSPQSNGDHRTCNYIDLNITIVNISSTNVTLVWENVTATRNLPAPVGYWLSYTHDPFGNITIYDEHQECYGSIWESTFVADHTTHQIVNLNPFTQYAYYIRLYTNSSENDGQTRLRRFTTLSDNPSELRHFSAISTASDSVILKWDYPVFPNGVPGRYELVVYFERDDEVFVAQRNFCKHPHYGHQDVSKVANATSDACCKKQHHVIPSNEFEFTCDTLNIMLNADANPGACKNFMYSRDANKKIIADIKSSAKFVPAVAVSAHKIVQRSFPTNATNIIEVTIEDPTITTYNVQPLKHFSMFVFVLKVCHKETTTQCSSPVMTFQRTLPKEEADDIPPGLSARIQNSSVIIAWSEPRQPNSMIVSYQIEYKSTDPDNSNPSTKCITRDHFIDSNHEYQIKELPPGRYVIRVKAVSLAGPGKFTPYVKFEMPQPPHSAGPTIAVTIGVITVVISILIGLFHYYRRYYKKRHTLDHEILLSNLSADYGGPSYLSDEWEIELEDVEISNKIIEGAFVTVYTGLIKSKNLPCVVKAPTRQEVQEKVSFLNEASVRKWYSNAHHVVKLLGVVSQVHQPLALMELASEGDLKAYLMHLNASSINTTTNEMYRMAAEVADGMAYLASKRFVHRDLAARNCLVSADHTVKIGDYGITKDVYAHDYYRKGTSGIIPVRWMAPESLATEVFTSDSDVWSYGVLLWEIVTFAQQPYQHLPNAAVCDYITSGGTLERPRQCPDLLYEIMERCWEWRPIDRPLFRDIVENFVSRVGEQFNVVSFYHSLEGLNFRRNAKPRPVNAPAPTRFSRSSSVSWNRSEDEVEI